MYVDEYRLRKGPKDHPPVCTDETCQFAHKFFLRTGKVFEGPKHLVSSMDCDGRPDYVAERAAVGSKHCPNKPTDACTF